MAAVLAAHVDLHNPDIIFGCESELDHDVPTQASFPHGYTIYRKERALTSGGRILWQLNRRYHLLNWLHLIPRQKRMISLWVSIHTAQTKELNLCTFYKPPSAHSTRIDFLAQSVSALYQRNKKLHPHIIIAGDFNFSDIKLES